MDDLIAFLRFLHARLDDDQLWAVEASRRDEGQAQPGGVHWQWVEPETDVAVEPDPSRGPMLTDEAENFRFSLRSVEEFPTSYSGTLPQFAIHTAEEVPAAVAGHIARHDPARVLAEVDAKRRMLAIHHPYVPEPDQACLGCAGGIVWTDCPVLRLLALPYASHPDYRAEWRP